MLTERNDKYEDWLKAIARTRLLYNTLDELENFMDSNAISSNGIGKVYNTSQKLRAAFRDLRVECSLMTDNQLDLDQILIEYERATKFFNRHLSRRKDMTDIATKMLQYFFGQIEDEEVPTRLLKAFKEVVEEDIYIEILLLLLLGALPGYNSKGGDVEDIELQWSKVMDFLDEFTRGCGGIVENIPAIEKARHESNKCRLMLIHHTIGLLGIYDSINDGESLYDTTTNIKELRVPLDMEGYWNECEGRADQTSFWQMESTVDDGVFFATKWSKKDSELLGIRYIMSFIRNDEGNLTVYLIDPEATRKRISGKPYGDEDHAWYSAQMPDTLNPDKLHLTKDKTQKSHTTNKWTERIPLARVTNQSIIDTYDKWFDTCHVINAYASSLYVFIPSLWATTLTASYVKDLDEDEELGEVYMVPRDSDERFKKIKLEDNVGILTMNGKRYLGFDESELYIPLEEEELLKYGIRKIKILEMI